MMKNAWKMMYVFPPIPIFICQQLFFCLSSNLFLEIQSTSITSTAIYYHQLLLLHISMPIQSKNKKEIFWKSKKTTVAWNCLCFTLIYYQSSFMLLRTTIYWQIGIKKIEISFQHKNCLVYLIVYIHYSDGWWGSSFEIWSSWRVLRVMRPTCSASKGGFILSFLKKVL